MRFGAAQLMKRRTPAADEPGVRVPAAALERVAEIQREIVATIAASGVAVIGDLATLTGGDAAGGAAGATAEGAAGAASDLKAGAEGVMLPPEVAASMAMGLLEVTGAIRQATISKGPFRFAEPVEVARVPTYQLFGALASRSWRAVVGRLVPGRRTSVQEPEPGSED